MLSFGLVPDRMTTLMNKFRIEFKSIEVVTDLNKHPNAERYSITDYINLINMVVTWLITNHC